MIKIKNFVKKHETKILVTTIIGGSIISAVLAKKITKNKMIDWILNIKVVLNQMYFFMWKILQVTIKNFTIDKKRWQQQFIDTSGSKYEKNSL